MFDSTLDIEQAFGHLEPMHRTYVRRRRTVAIVATALIAVLAEPAGCGGGPARGSAAAAPRSSVVVVREGDTLWSIAQRRGPGADPRAMAIAEIDRMNVWSTRAGSLPVAVPCRARRLTPPSCPG